MIEHLAANHQKWLVMAKKICGSKKRDAAEDLVQDMYVKLLTSNTTEICNKYVYDCLNSIFIDGVRKASKKDTISLSDAWEFDEIIEPLTDDEQNQYLADAINYEMAYQAAAEVTEESKRHEKIIMYFSTAETANKFIRASKIPRVKVFQIRKQFKEKTWQQLKQKSPQDWETLSQALQERLESKNAQDAPKEKTPLTLFSHSIA